MRVQCEGRLSSELENGFGGESGMGGEIDDGMGRVKIARTAESRESKVERSTAPSFGEACDVMVIVMENHMVDWVELCGQERDREMEVS